MHTAQTFEDQQYKSKTENKHQRGNKLNHQKMLDAGVCWRFSGQRLNSEADFFVHIYYKKIYFTIRLCLH